MSYHEAKRHLEKLEKYLLEPQDGVHVSRTIHQLALALNDARQELDTVHDCLSRACRIICDLKLDKVEAFLTKNDQLKDSDRNIRQAEAENIGQRRDFNKSREDTQLKHDDCETKQMKADNLRLQRELEKAHRQNREAQTTIHLVEAENANLRVRADDAKQERFRSRQQERERDALLARIC